MKKTTQKKITKRLAQYSALTVALAGLTDANGQIDYTDVDPDFVGGNGTSAGLDLDNDGNFDFVIIGSSAPAVGIRAYNTSVSGNSFVGTAPLYTYPFALDNGNVISSGLTTWFGGTDVGTLNYVSCYGGAGSSSWCGVTDKYLGLRFLIGENTHYGWARLDVSASGDSFTLKDYAYNTVADAPINAGQTLSTEDVALREQIKVVPLNKTIALYNLPESTSFKLYSMTGKSVMSGNIANDTYVVEASNVANGIYIIEITDEITKAVFRKKVVL